MRLRLKWWFIAKVALVVVVAAVAVHLVHQRQVRQQTGAFLHQADLARDAGNPEAEARHLKRYLLARPDDLDARERLGRVLVGNAKGGKQLLDAYLILDDLLRRDPGRADLRRFVIDVTMRPQI